MLMCLQIYMSTIYIVRHDLFLIRFECEPNSKLLTHTTVPQFYIYSPPLTVAVVPG